jgi:hypothetical protein
VARLLRLSTTPAYLALLSLTVSDIESNWTILCNNKLLTYNPAVPRTFNKIASRVNVCNLTRCDAVGDKTERCPKLKVIDVAGTLAEV